MFDANNRNQHLHPLRRRLSQLRLRCCRTTSARRGPVSHTGQIRPVVIPQARHVQFGLACRLWRCIGWHWLMEITPEMVGRRVAVFVSLKAGPWPGRTIAEQAGLRLYMTLAGLRCARSEGEAGSAIMEWMR